MATTQVSTLSPVYTFTIRQRAALQVIAHAMQYLGGCQRLEDAQLLARLAALDLMWQARERILRAAERPRRPIPRLYREALEIVWRNPQAGAR